MNLLLNIFNINLNLNLDAPSAWGVYFQDSATPQMEGLVELHDNIMYYLVVILFAVGWILLSIIRNYVETRSPISHKYLNHGTLIELIWTITPAVILMLIAFPSFKLLYLMDEVSDPSMSVLAEGQGGPKPYILNKIVNTWKGQRKYNIFILNNFQYRTFHNRMKAGSRIGPHNQDVLSVIIGSLLGNAWITRSVEGTRICYRQSSKNKEYLFWLYYFFYNLGYCSNLEPRRSTIKLKHKGIECVHYRYEFNTFTFRSFNWIHEMFYHKGKKVLKPKLEKYMTPLCLAVWIFSQPNGYEELKLYTGLRREEDINKLIFILKNKYGFICYSFIDKNSFYGISIANESKYSFRALLQLYLYIILNSNSCASDPSKSSINLSLNTKIGLPPKLVKGNRYYSTKGSSLPVISYSNPLNFKICYLQRK